MKLFIPKITWIGNHGRFINRAFENNSVDVVNNSHDFTRNKLIGLLRLREISFINQYEMYYYLNQYGNKLIDECLRSKPDIFFTFNESRILPHIYKAIKEKCKCMMVCAIGDDPWDSARWIANFPHSLKYFDLIFCGDPIWISNIRKVAPNAKIHWHYGGFDPDFFHPIDARSISNSDIERFTCDLSFTGSSYAKKPEGAYRSDILSYLSDFNLQIWGGDNWQYRFKFLPNLKDKYRGSRLTYDDLRKLYTLTKINLNLPAPQVELGFQPRVFEIAAVKGFQIIDNRPMLRKLFAEDEIVTFDTIDELREKIKYYLKHDDERIQLTDRLYKKVTENYTWNHWAKYILDVINGSYAYQDIHIPNWIK